MHARYPLLIRETHNAHLSDQRPAYSTRGDPRTCWYICCLEIMTTGASYAGHLQGTRLSSPLVERRSTCLTRYGDRRLSWPASRPKDRRLDRRSSQAARASAAFVFAAASKRRANRVEIDSMSSNIKKSAVLKSVSTAGKPQILAPIRK